MGLRQRLIEQIDAHDRQLVNSTIAKMKHQLSSEIEFSNMTTEEKTRMTALVKKVAGRMRIKELPDLRG